MQTMRTCASTARASKHIRRVRVQKGAVNSENNQFIGVSHGGKTTKIHAVVDALGNPVHFLLTGGNIFDASVAVDLLSKVKISGSNILGDKAYGTNSIRTYITEQRASYTIPPKSNVIEPWFCDFHTYKERQMGAIFPLRTDSKSGHKDKRNSSLPLGGEEFFFQVFSLGSQKA